ncbi:MAG TPA: DUF5666 domain-containing protein [Terracidiphilus sp.]|nr:DUF5666 domain-containing protein [Terracidiphilus sp.]
MTPRQKALKGALCVVAVHAVVAVGLAACLSSAMAQTSPHIMTGYITAVHPPDGFDVNGDPVMTTGDTTYGPMGFEAPVKNGPMRDSVAVGAWVEVVGILDRHSKIVTAHSVLIRENPDRKLDGLGVIVKVISTAPEAVFAADGYRIRITPATEVRYPKEMKSPADVHPGLWVLYEGKLDRDGLLEASKVRFLETEHAKTKDNVPPPIGPPDPAVAELPDGKRVMQLDDNTTYTVTADPALQARINRIGMSLVPAYQKQLPENDPSKIKFYFYAIDDPMHEVHWYPDGRILVSAQVAARFKSDDQLAAVLADGVARSFQAQMPVVIRFNRTTLTKAAEVAGWAALVGVPAATVVVYDASLKPQRARVALLLMAEAGYDPWQAPEAWRLVGPFKLPKDIGKLKYPAQSDQDFEILHLIYGRPAATDATEASSMARGSANEKP